VRHWGRSVLIPLQGHIFTPRPELSAGLLRFESQLVGHSCPPKTLEITNPYSFQLTVDLPAIETAEMSVFSSPVARAVREPKACCQAQPKDSHSAVATLTIEPGSTVEIAVSVVCKQAGEFRQPLQLAPACALTVLVAAEPTFLSISHSRIEFE
jgi:hypothetical protein